ncbi:MAG: succinylglutamate desuccinylase/aspartoacylase family protein [Planctomycetota bacterium]
MTRVFFFSLFFFIYAQNCSAQGTERYGIWQDSGYSLSYLRWVVPQPRCSVLILGGIHGNEPAGSVAATTFLEHWKKQPEALSVNITLIPRCNLFGLLNDSRLNREQLDLNRQFRQSTCVEIRIIQEIAKQFQPYDLFLDLHEDGWASGCYVYEMVQPGLEAFQSSIFEHYPESFLPIDLEGNRTYFQKAVGGVASYGKQFYQISQLPGVPWSSMMWASFSLRTPYSYTLETPKQFAMEQRQETAHYLAKILIQKVLRQKE